MTKTRFQLWEKQRAKGILWFIGVYGLILWSIPMIILTGFIGRDFDNGITTQSLFNHCLKWVVAGIGYGILAWFFNEYRFKKSQKEFASN